MMGVTRVRLTLALLLVQCFTGGAEVESHDTRSVQLVAENVVLDQRKDVPDEAEFVRYSRLVEDETGDQSFIENEALSVREAAKKRYSYPTDYSYNQKISQTERELQVCCREMGWPMPRIVVSTNMGWRLWAPYDDRRKRQSSGYTYVQNLAEKLSLLERELLKCQQAKALQTPSPPTPDYPSLIRALELEVGNLIRLLRWCIKLGGFSFIKVNRDKRSQLYQIQRVAKLQTLKTLYQSEVNSCFKSIGRLPNGELIPTPPPPTTPIPTTTPVPTTPIPTTTPVPTTPIPTTTPVPTTPIPTTTPVPTTTPWPTTTLPLTTTSGIFTTTIPSTTLC